MRTHALAGDSSRNLAPVSLHRGAWVLRKRKPMSAYDSPVKESPDRRGVRPQAAEAHDTPDRVPDNALCIGVDAKGAKHFERRGTVWVVEDGELTHECDIDSRDVTLGEYADAVAETRGDWQACCVMGRLTSPGTSERGP